MGGTRGPGSEDRRGSDHTERVMNRYMDEENIGQETCTRSSENEREEEEERQREKEAEEQKQPDTPRRNRTRKQTNKSEDLCLSVEEQGLVLVPCPVFRVANHTTGQTAFFTRRSNSLRL
jgi:hypothetical protein